MARLDGRVNLYDFAIGGTMPQLIDFARKRVPRQLTAEERQLHLPAPFLQQKPVSP
jgi:hypothetical protein